MKRDGMIDRIEDNLLAQIEIFRDGVNVLPTHVLLLLPGTYEYYPAGPWEVLVPSSRPGMRSKRKPTDPTDFGKKPKPVCILY